MKRTTIVLLNVILILCSIIPVNAANEITFIMTDAQCNNNRLFTTDVKAKSIDMFSVATFEFTYDRSIIEFREVSCDDNSYVRAYDNGKSVVVSYLCSDGIKIEDYTTIFTMKFKSISVGETKIDYTVRNCVNSGVEDMPIAGCTSSLITVNSKSSDNKENSKSENKSKNNSSNNSSFKNNTDTYQNLHSSIDQLGFLNENIFDNEKDVFLMIAVVAVVVVAAFCLGRIFPKNILKNKNSKAIDTEENIS